MGLSLARAAGVLTLVAGALYAASASAAEPVQDDLGADLGGGYAGVRANADKLSYILGLSRSDASMLRGLLLVQSYSESHGNNLAANRTDSERAAARKLYFARGNDDAIKAALGSSWTTSDWYTPGSAGWFGLMPSVILNVVKGKDARGVGLGPHSNTDPWASVVIYAAYLDRLRRRPEWGKSPQDAYTLKIGGAAGSLMDEVDDDDTNDDAKETRAKKAMSNLDRAVSKLGLPSDFGARRVNASKIFGGRDWLKIYKTGRAL